MQPVESNNPWKGITNTPCSCVIEKNCLCWDCNIEPWDWWPQGECDCTCHDEGRKLAKVNDAISKP